MSDTADRDRSIAVPGWYHPARCPRRHVEEAFAYCEARAKAHYENFPVGLFVPREKRRYVYAIYTFARAADDFADEPIYEGVRQEKLDQWETLTHAAFRGEAEGPIFVALAETVRRLGIPKELLLDLLSAFRQDTDPLVHLGRGPVEAAERTIAVFYDALLERLKDPSFLTVIGSSSNAVRLGTGTPRGTPSWCSRGPARTSDAASSPSTTQITRASATSRCRGAILAGGPGASRTSRASPSTNGRDNYLGSRGLYLDMPAWGLPRLRRFARPLTRRTHT